jgi:hypothetical protein
MDTFLKIKENIGALCEQIIMELGETIKPAVIIDHLTHQSFPATTSIGSSSKINIIHLPCSESLQHQCRFVDPLLVTLRAGFVSF